MYLVCLGLLHIESLIVIYTQLFHPVISMSLSLICDHNSYSVVQKERSGSLLFIVLGYFFLTSCNLVGLGGQFKYIHYFLRVQR
jgi:hypothetical protein